MWTIKIATHWPPNLIMIKKFIFLFFSFFYLFYFLLSSSLFSLDFNSCVQSGSKGEDCVWHIAPHGVDLLIAGYTDQSTEDKENKLGFITEYDSSLNLKWQKRFDDLKISVIYRLAADNGNTNNPSPLEGEGRERGDFFAVGCTESSVLDQPRFGGRDGVLLKLDSTGNVLWLKRFGTDGSDFAGGLAIDPAGNIYVTGDTDGDFPEDENRFSTKHGYLKKYDKDGNSVFTREFCSDKQDWVRSMALTPDGNILVCGDTYGVFPGQSNKGNKDSFVIKFDPNGVTLWVKEFGTDSNDYAYSVKTDPVGNIYLTGDTSGVFPGCTNSGGTDGYLVKLDSNGNEIWTRQFGSPEGDEVKDLIFDNSGNICLTGYTNGALRGINSGYEDVFITKYDPSGNENTPDRIQYGSTECDEAMSIAIDKENCLYSAGFTYGLLPAQKLSGDTDSFIIKFR